MDTNLELNQDFREFVELLNKNDVRYLVVGGYAIAAHGHPRYTKDFDVWLWIESANAARIVNALEEFGFGTLGLSKETFLKQEQIIQLGYPPQRIDLLTSVDGVEFEACWARKATFNSESTPVQVIGEADLIINKKASGRTQDLADIEALKSNE